MFKNTLPKQTMTGWDMLGGPGFFEFHQAGAQIESHLEHQQPKLGDSSKDGEPMWYTPEI